MALYLRGRKIGLFQGGKVGETILVMKLINTIKKVHKSVSVFRSVGEKPSEENDLFEEMNELEVHNTDKSTDSKDALIYWKMNEAPGARLRVGLILLKIAEYFKISISNRYYYLLKIYFDLCKLASKHQHHQAKCLLL